MTQKEELKAKRPARLAQAYQSTFRTIHGKKVLFDLMDQHYMMAPCFSTDPLEMARMEGERNVILRILKLLKTDINKLEQMIDEALSETQS